MSNEATPANGFLTDGSVNLPEPLNKGRTGFGQLWNRVYSYDQMRQYAEAQVDAKHELCLKIALNLVAHFKVNENHFTATTAQDVADAILLWPNVCANRHVAVNGIWARTYAHIPIAAKCPGERMVRPLRGSGAF